MTRGRPRTGSLLTASADVAPAVFDRAARELPITASDIATDLGTSRRTLARVIERDTGEQWATWIVRILPPGYLDDGDDAGMKRVTISLSDESFAALRREALDQLRDPRIVARLILERDLANRARPAQPVRPAQSTAN